MKCQIALEGILILRTWSKLEAIDQDGKSGIFHKVRASGLTVTLVTLSEESHASEESEEVSFFLKSHIP